MLRPHNPADQTTPPLPTVPPMMSATRHDPLCPGSSGLLGVGSTVYGLIQASHLLLDLSWKQFSSPIEKLIWQIMILSAFCRTNLGISPLRPSAALIS